MPLLLLLALALVLLSSALPLEERRSSSPIFWDTVGQVNFQGSHACASRPRLLAPLSEEQLRQIVASSSSIKPVGAGAGWNSHVIGCAARNGSNVVTAGLCNALELTAAAPFYLAPANGTAADRGADVLVDEARKTVTVRTCVTVQALHEYLATYRTSSAPNGYMLSHPATLFMGQTVGGIIATAAHGSSLVEGGWPSKLLAARVMLADGRILEDVTAESHPLLFRALKTSVGRLGIILHVKLAIMRQAHISASWKRVSPRDFLQRVSRTEAIISSALELRAHSPKDDVAADSILRKAPLHLTFGHLQVLQNWHPRLFFDKWVVGREGSLAYKPPADKRTKEQNFAAWHEWIDVRRSYSPFGVLDGPRGQKRYLEWEKILQLPSRKATFLWKGVETKPGESHCLWHSDPLVCARRTSGQKDTPSLADYLLANHAERIGQPPPAYHRWTTMTKGSPACYNQTEFGVPWYNAVRCLSAFLNVSQALVVRQRLNDVALRWTGVDDSFLSPTRSFPRMYLNLDTLRGERLPQPIVDVLRGPQCGAAIHWGKHGWDYEHEVRNNTIEQMGPSWCQFGCIANAVDPHSKFVGEGLARNVWTFSAFSSSAGRIVSGSALDKHCCVRSGEHEARFDTTRCTCAANTQVGSERAIGACALMRSAELRSLVCGEDREDEWMLMQGCRWDELGRVLRAGRMDEADLRCASHVLSGGPT